MQSTDVLIVEDEAVIAMDLTRRLQKLGYRVATTVPSGEEALAWTARQRPDLVLMDIVLCGQLDGIHTADELRRQYGLPVIFLTAYSDDKTLSRASGARPYGYLLKPFDDRELYTAVEMALYRARSERQLQESEERFRLIAENAPDFILVLEPDGEIKFLNHSGDLPYTQIIGTNLRDWVNAGQRGALQAALHTAQSGTRVEVELPATVLGLGERWFNARVAPLRVDGKITSLIAVCTDITERRQAEETQRRYAAELEAQNVELDAFAHTVAHDLKNPVGHIAGYLELLQWDYRRFSDEARLDIIARANAATGRLATIIDELLTLSRIRRAEVNVYAISMDVVVTAALSRLAEQIQQAKAVIIQPQSWPPVLGHGQWLEEVWVNYLSNALKYGGQPPRIELGFDQLADGELRFWVHDNGRGLSAEEQARLFVPFTRLSETVSHGHGLGLSIVRRVADKLGGQAGVESAPGEGTRFYFTLRPAPTGAPSETDALLAD